MNKKIWGLVLLMLCLIYLDAPKAQAAEEYNGYSEVIMQEGKLLANFTDAEYEEYYSKINNRLFWGWNIYIVNQNVPCTYINKTVYETTNTGSETITYEINVTTEQEIRTIISASGSISYGLSGSSEKKFKHDLDAKVSLDYKYQNTESNTKTEKLKIPVEGRTKLLVTVVGTGMVTNGVGSYYICWFENCRGGFEYFTITNEFQKIEKVSYDEEIN